MMQEKYSQRQAILKHLENGGVLTALDALRLFACNRLAARIGELRQQGHAIRSDAFQMNGKRFAAYRIESGAVHES